MEAGRADGIWWPGVKSSDSPKTNRSEGVWQVRVLRSSTKVRGAKVIRYRCSPVTVNDADRGLDGVEKKGVGNRCFLYDLFGALRETRALAFGGEYCRKAET